MSRSVVLTQISHIEDEYCKNCEFRQNNSYCFKHCDIANQLKGLGNQLIEISQEKQKHLLAKGKDMKSSEIVYLINRGIPKTNLIRHLGMGTDVGYRMIGRLQNELSRTSK